MATIDKLIDTAELEAALQDLAHDVEAGYKERLLREDHVATGELIQSVRAEVVVNGAVFEVVLHLADYWKYVEEDTKAHWPPRGDILKWIKAKPVLPHPDENGRIPSPESLAYLISRSIAGKSPNQQFLKNPHGGTIGTHDLRETTDAVIPYWKDRLRDILGRMYGDYIQRVISFPLP